MTFLNGPIVTMKDHLVFTVDVMMNMKCIQMVIIQEPIGTLNNSHKKN